MTIIEWAELEDLQLNRVRIDDDDLAEQQYHQSEEVITKEFENVTADMLTSMIVTLFGVLREKNYRRFLATIGGIHKAAAADVEDMFQRGHDHDNHGLGVIIMRQPPERQPDEKAD